MLIAALALSAPVLAADGPEFTPEAQIRPRAEWSTGRDGTSGSGDALVITQRSRLGGSLSFEGISARLVVQDIRAWGTEANTLTDFNADNLDVHVASLAWKPADDVTITVGRQEITFNEHRLIGNVNWAQQARAFDAARVQYTGDKLFAEAFGSMLYEGDQVDATTLDSTLWAGRGGFKSGANEANLTAIYEHMGEADMDRATIGVYAKGGSGILSGRVEGYGQLGSSGNASIGAWMVGVRGTVAPDVSFKPQITLWYDHLSGDGDMTDDKVGAFNTLYATNHKFYGQIDMANFGIAGASDGRGLQDIALKLAASPSDKWTANLDAHAFLASANQGGDTSISQEVDLWSNVKITKGLGFGIGAAAWLPSYTADADFWAWSQLNAKL